MKKNTQSFIRFFNLIILFNSILVLSSCQPFLQEAQARETQSRSKKLGESSQKKTPQKSLSLKPRTVSSSSSALRKSVRGDSGNVRNKTSLKSNRNKTTSTKRTDVRKPVTSSLNDQAVTKKSNRPLLHDEMACLKANQLDQFILKSIQNPQKEPKIKRLEQSIVNAYRILSDRTNIRDSLLKKGLQGYRDYLPELRNNKFLTLVDMNLPSDEPRMFVIDMYTLHVKSYHVSHGRGSAPQSKAIAEVFSNKEGSFMTSLGFYLVSETYQSPNHGLALKLDGLSRSNCNARVRDIVMHGADYVRDENVVQGRSLGCPAVSNRTIKRIAPLIKGKSLMLIDYSK